MKIKSLLLTGMAALAMFSCSNENDPTIANEEAKDAAFTFSFTMPNVATRADATDKGTPEEQKVNDITLELDYAGTTPTFTKTYNAADFTKNENIYTLTAAESVVPGTVKMNIYVNTKGVTGVIESASTFSLGNFASTTENGGNFAMSGELLSYPITANIKNVIDKPIPVSRIAAKLVEVSDADEVEGRQLKYKAKASVLDIAANLNIELLDYSFSNLNKKSNTLASLGKYYAAADFWNILPEVATWGDFGTAIKEMTDQTTYCFENNATAPTTIWYKAQATFDGYTAGDNFYVYDNIAYATFAKLNDEVYQGGLTEGLSLTDESTIADFMAQGIMKYEAGICYYSMPIKTNGEVGIDRNNWYKLAVTGINDLGLNLPVPPPVGTPTLLIFSATVQPWTVIDFGYDL